MLGDKGGWHHHSLQWIVALFPGDSLSFSFSATRASSLDTVFDAALCSKARSEFKSSWRLSACVFGAVSFNFGYRSPQNGSSLAAYRLAEANVLHRLAPLPFRVWRAQLALTALPQAAIVSITACGRFMHKHPCWSFPCPGEGQFLAAPGPAPCQYWP